ncbi:transcriptional regulator [Intrasporangium chromatireducens Q5-1]|uniref:Transcriptional regulator n=1 Tax=Intrasporangium chromatireducens Q5-1 TaxID=584657 RepID=W9GLU5_9MICO|nr:helix-turn-helix domain-containing protein [Intrasporangium chromatireducens]EWT07231.1 transcriptional regulator [Intrasporangium chromatireducens Q5-1]
MRDRAPLGTELLTSSVRRRIVDVLANLPPVRDPHTGAKRPAEGLSARDLADRLHLHVTTMRFHLDQLVAGGLVTSHFMRGGGAGRPRKLYAIAHGSLDRERAEQSFALLSEVLVQSFGVDDDQSRTPEELGARWARHRVQQEERGDTRTSPARTPGQWLGKIGRMVDILEEWGYTPEVSTTDGGRTARVALHGCPFIDLARDNTALVCGIHRGLMRGVMEELGEEHTQISLTPFVTPHLCVAALTTGTARGSTSPRTPLIDKEIRS